MPPLIMQQLMDKRNQIIFADDILDLEESKDFKRLL